MEEEEPFPSSFPVNGQQVKALLIREGRSEKELAKRGGISQKSVERAVKGERLHLATIGDIARAFQETRVTADMLIVGDIPHVDLPPITIILKTEEEREDLDETPFLSRLVAAILRARQELGAHEIQIKAIREGCMEIELRVSERAAEVIRDLFATGDLKDFGIGSMPESSEVIIKAQPAENPVEPATSSVNANALSGWDLQRYRDYLVTRARLLILNPRIKSRFDPDDLAQETFLKACRGPVPEGLGTSDESRLGWLERILVNQFMKKYREFTSQRRDVNREQELTREVIETTSRWNPVESVIPSKDLLRVATVVLALAPDERDAVLALEFLHLSLDEAGEALDKPKQQVDALRRAGLASLAKLL